MSQTTPPAAPRHPAYAPINADEAQARSRAVRALLKEWRGDLSGYEEDQAEAIERALLPTPLSLREYGGK